MRARNLVTAAIAAGAIGAAATATPASADNIVLNQWYGGTFQPSPAPQPLSGGPALYVLGTNGPVLPGGFANAITAPAPGWQITLPRSGTLTVTDIEASGDMFQMFDNGVAMTPAASPFTAPFQNPGQAALAGGLTSLSTVGGAYEYSINGALGDPFFSSGTFRLNPGANVITGTWLLPNNQGVGDFGFIAESVPEPTTWALLLVGFAGLGFASYRRARAAISLA